PEALTADTLRTFITSVALGAGNKDRHDSIAAFAAAFFIGLFAALFAARCVSLFTRAAIHQCIARTQWLAGDPYHRPGRTHRAPADRIAGRWPSAGRGRAGAREDARDQDAGGSHCR